MQRFMKNLGGKRSRVGNGKGKGVRNQHRQGRFGDPVKDLDPVSEKKWEPGWGGEMGGKVRFRGQDGNLAWSKVVKMEGCLHFSEKPSLNPPSCKRIRPVSKDMRERRGGTFLNKLLFEAW